ncbi:hypothetical protein [uncultured Paraglaciecola sp.]|uniref:hypothetical protein n=1 Tax=uncultured Paraglaciecola sp. TaxID=1765024 RepID=UPI002630D064|nr:hypothetical protein [uncultured Paraglaciecola sp.]
MTQVNLRQNQAQKLTIQQGDESLIHLSNVHLLTGTKQLHTGGKYRTDGTFSCPMPADGNNVEVHVISGMLTLVGVVDGITNPVLTAGQNREYVKVGAEWHVLTSGGASIDSGLGNFRSYAASATVSPDDPLLWFDTTSDAVCTLPSSLPVDTTFGIVRGGAGGLRVVGTSESIFVDGVADPQGVDFNERGRIAWFRKSPTGWTVAV